MYVCMYGTYVCTCIHMYSIALVELHGTYVHATRVRFLRFFCEFMQVL